MSAFFDFDEIERDEMSPTASRKVVYEGDLMFVLFELKPGPELALHRHPHTQMATLLQGKIQATVGEEKRILEPMAGYRVPSNAPHGVKVLSEEPAVVLDCFTPIRQDFL